MGPPRLLYALPDFTTSTQSSSQALDATQIQCELLGQFGSLGWWLQGVLIIMCFLSLVFKRFTDKVRRPWKVWFFDASKQGVQAFMNHALNLGLAKAFGELIDSDSDPCNWYLVNLTLDCTLGVLILFFLLRMLQCIYRTSCVDKPELARCGEYGQPPEWRIFWRQLLDWQALVFVQKILLASMVICLREKLAFVAMLLLGWMDANPSVKLVVVMVVAPVAMSVLAMWVADSFLQADMHHHPQDEYYKAEMHSDTTDDSESDLSENLELWSYADWKLKGAAHTTLGRQHVSKKKAMIRGAPPSPLRK